MWWINNWEIIDSKKNKRISKIRFNYEISESWKIENVINDNPYITINILLLVELYNSIS